jgi:hypothetical protein
MNALEVSRRLEEIRRAIVQINRALDSIRLEPHYVQAAIDVLEIEKKRLSAEENSLKDASKKSQLRWTEAPDALTFAPSARMRQYGSARFGLQTAPESDPAVFVPGNINAAGCLDGIAEGSHPV